MRELARRLKKIEAAIGTPAPGVPTKPMPDLDMDTAMAMFLAAREGIGMDPAEDAEWAALTPHQALERFDAYRRSIDHRF